MGLGKTTSTIIAALETGAKKILIICPATLKINWKREIENYSDRSIFISEGKTFSTEHDFVIINYDIIKNFHDTKKNWQTVYGDISAEELKQIKNKPKIYCKNKFRMKFKYIKDKAVYKGKSAVMFIPSRKWCRELATHLKTNPYRTDYKEQ